MRMILHVFAACCVLVCTTGIVDAGLVSRWKFDEIIPGDDSSDASTPDSVSGFDLIFQDPLVPALGTPAPTLGGSSLVLPGRSPSINLHVRTQGHDPELFTPSFTAMAWNKAGDEPTGLRAIFGTRSSSTTSGSDGFVLYRRADRYYEARLGDLGSTSENPNDVLRTPDEPLDDTWQHAAMSFDATTDLGGGSWEGVLRIYIDGKLEAEGVRRYTPRTTGSYYVGSNASRSFYFAGSIDDARYYDMVLTGAQIRSLVPEPSALSFVLVGALTLLARGRTR